MSKETRAAVIQQLNVLVRENQNLTDEFDQFVADSIGVNRTDYRCMDILERNGPMTAGELATAAHLTTGAVTALLDRLEKAGFVTRARDTADRRRVMVQLTSEARLRLGAYFLGIIEGVGEMYRHSTTDQLRLVADFLRRGNEMLAGHMARVKASPPSSPAPSRTRPSTGGRPGR